MPCGCISSCGCDVTSGAGLITQKVGNTIAINLDIADSDCISLTFLGNDLIAVPIIDPADTAVPITCGPNGLSADLDIQDGDTVDLDVSGGYLTAEVIIDPADTAVQLSSSAAGLSAELDIQDGQSVDLDVSGGFLTAEVILDPASTGASIGPDGLLVEAGAGSFVTLNTDQTITGQKTFDATIIEGVQSFAASGNILADGGRIVAYSGAAAQTLTLPPATVGLSFDIFNIDSTDSVTIDGDAAETIDGSATIIVPAGGRAQLRCISAGSWVTWRTGTSAAQSGAGTNITGTVNPAYTTVQSITVGPGRYLVTGNGYFDVSTGVTTIYYYLQLYNSTAATVINEVIDTQESFTSWRSPAFVQQIVTVSVNSTFQLRASVGIASGTQLIRNTSIVALSI